MATHHIFRGLAYSPRSATEGCCTLANLADGEIRAGVAVKELQFKLSSVIVYHKSKQQTVVDPRVDEFKTDGTQRVFSATKCDRPGALEFSVNFFRPINVQRTLRWTLGDVVWLERTLQYVVWINGGINQLVSYVEAPVPKLVDAIPLMRPDSSFLRG